jgi:hypothetical protein
MRPSLLLITVLLALGLLGAASLSAQAPDPAPTVTPMILGPVTQVTPTPAPPGFDDPRRVICSAPFLPGFVPQMIRPGDRLPDLMVGVLNLTVTQAAALNCLDDPLALPVGALIWLPQVVSFEAAPSPLTPSTAAPAITRLTVDPPQLQNTGSLTLTWEGSGDYAYLYVCGADAHLSCARPPEHLLTRLPVSYTTPPIGGFRYAGPLRYRLEVVAGSQSATQDVTVEVRCANERLGRTSSGLLLCPNDAPRSTEVLAQPFESGLMLAFPATGDIWALTSDDRLYIYPGAANSSIQASTTVEGLAFPPAPAFAAIWAQLAAGEHPLGPPIESPRTVEAVLQPAGQVSYTTYLQLADVTYAITRLPGDSRGWWFKL